MARCICKCGNEWEQTDGIHSRVAILHMMTCYKCFPNNPRSDTVWAEDAEGKYLPRVDWDEPKGGGA